MNWLIYAIECIVILILFTCVIMIPLCRNPVWWIHDYPQDIQEKYFETHERIPTQPLSLPVLVKKGAALILALFLLAGLVLLAGADDFGSAFLASYGIWFLVDWYDCFFLDWVLFANVKRIRLPGTEHMDQAYHQKKYHVVHSAIGMVLGLIPCLLCGLIVMAI
ncbi:MAG: hypothetical protein MSA09_06675 [Lachnospiraceae bacterium]|nr:hypothetical protein [Lachnospiraceae bacterium]